jgi:ATP-dependent exoDNAse (exonuclease V) beta subunit
MSIRIITASAGTGKTTRLAALLNEAVSKATARPEAILATTFTKQAAAELLNRARTGLLQNGRGREAQALLTARIGTVNAVCGALVAEFSFELGLSPELRVLDEAGAELALKRSLATVVTDEVSDRLQAFKAKFDYSFDWHYEVRRLIEAARANGLDADRFAASAERSVASLDACLGPVLSVETDLDGDLRAAIDAALAAIRGGGDTTKGTQEYCSLLAETRDNLDRECLRWGDWAKLTTQKPTKKSVAHAAPVQAAAARHLGHPRLRKDLHELVRLMFEVAANGLRAYQEFKREQGLLDFVDQEVHALDLLSRPAIRDVLKDDVDLVLVDEFQDTSPLQLAIFLKLAELAKESVWVGDPKQAIYGFRGTDPALMDAAIESLSNPARDPDLVAAAVSEITRAAPVETLSKSYRSRPTLVSLTNAVFSRAFSQQQGMAAERVMVESNREESPDLGLAIGQWPLSAQGRMNKEQLSHAVAAGVRDLIGTPPTVWDRHTSVHRTATASDLAILCRTNEQCRHVSEALGRLGIASVVARVGLREAAEAQILLAGLRLWVDRRDRLAAATLMRILEHPQDAAAFLDEVLAEDGDQRLAACAPVKALLTAREAGQDLDVLAAVDVVLDVLDLRALCAAWGDQVQRIANLDGLRAHAGRYVEECRAGGEVPSLVGFLTHFDELVSNSGWGTTRQDTIARVESEHAVTVSTWHAAKGLEWPIVVLFGLESLRAPEAYGVHVLSDRTTFDVSDPLGGRWIHFWPNPYTTSNQNGPVKDAYAQSDAYHHVSRQADREALRVLYVGWTRARDRVVLAAHDGKLLDGLLGTLSRIDATLVNDPGVTAAAVVDVVWADHPFRLDVRPSQPVDAVVVQPEPGCIRVGKAPVERAAATLSPSSAPPRQATLGEPVRLGDLIRMRASVGADVLGTAVHAFLSADDPRRPAGARREIAAGLLDRFGVGRALEPTDLMELADRLWRWVNDRFGEGCVVRTEWPLGMKLESGTLVLGSADLIVESAEMLAVVDHKSMGLATATREVEGLAGQLGSYADAVKCARPGKPVSTWVHMPFEGVVVEVRLSAPQ